MKRKVILNACKLIFELKMEICEIMKKSNKNKEIKIPYYNGLKLI